MAFSLSSQLPSGRSGRLTAWGLLAALLGFLWFGALSPALNWFAARQDQIAQQAILTARLERLAAQLPALEELAKTGAKPAAVQPLSDESDQVAAARLQDLLQQAATQTGATVSSVEIVTDANVAAPANGLAQVAVRANVSAPFTALVALLQKLAANPNGVVVEGMELHGPLRAVGDSDPEIDAMLTASVLHRTGP